MTKRHEQLLQAIARDDRSRVRALLEEAPDLVTARDPEGRTPLLFALYLGREELARTIRERVPDPDLFEAAAMGEASIVGELVAATPSLANMAAPDGFGPLGLAAYFGRLDAARVLLEAGADPNTPAKNRSRVRPLHSAVANRDSATALAMARLLLEWNADPNMTQAGGWTPLHAAAAHGRVELVRLLLEHEASREVTSEDGRTPLDMARAKGRAEAEKLLAVRES